MHNEQVITQLKEMHLSVMAESFQNRLDTGDNRDITPEQFFALLVEDEYMARKNRKLRRLITAADFKPEQACIENLEYSTARGLQKADVMQLTTPTWIEDARHIISTGLTGCGKTYLAEALGLQACKMGYRVRKVRYRILFEEIRAAKGVGTYLKYLKKTALTSVLIIDDFLMQPIEQADAANLMDIIEEKQQQGSIVVTTQYPVNKWHHQLPDPTIADAICDRLVHGAYMFNLKGESMRKKTVKSGSK
jgi:DNA replication protein DnaC